MCSLPGGFGRPGVNAMSFILITLTPRQEDLELLLCTESLFVDLMVRRIAGGRAFFLSFLALESFLLLITFAGSPFFFICFNIIINNYLLSILKYVSSENLI
jgi:hypothetical protein